MNTTIRELAEEAGFVVPRSGIVSEDFNIRTEDGVIVDEQLNKFAELVIRNCAAIAIEEADFCETKMMPFSTMEWKILKRFGIDCE